MLAPVKEVVTILTIGGSVLLLMIPILPYQGCVRKVPDETTQHHWRKGAAVPHCPMKEKELALPHRRVLQVVRPFLLSYRSLNQSPQQLHLRLSPELKLRQSPRQNNPHFYRLVGCTPAETGRSGTGGKSGQLVRRRGAPHLITRSGTKREAGCLPGIWRMMIIKNKREF